MRTRVWSSFALAIVALLAAGISIALILASDHVDADIALAILTPTLGLGFVATGLFARWRRPGNRTGGLMILVGLLWFAGILVASNSPAVFAVGVALSLLFYAGLTHLLLAFPVGRLRSRRERVLTAGVYVAAFGHRITQLLLKPRPLDGARDPHNPLLLSDQPALAEVVDVVWAVISLVVIALVIREVILRWRHASAAQRRGLALVLWTGAVALAGLAAAVAAQSVRLPEPISAVMLLVSVVALLALPYAFLAGLLRARYSRAGAVDDLITGLARASDRQNLRDSLADAIGDPTLDLVFHLAQRDEWVDAGGRRYAMPDAHDPSRAVTLVERDGEPIGALVHDAELRDEPQLLGTAAAAASLAVDNDRLAAELRARIMELEDSRAKVVTGALTERRRLERDLHDGAQQRLVALSLQLGLAGAKMTSDPQFAGALVHKAGEELRLALEELRELARGIHPAVLTDRGLHAAVEALADRSPVPVHVRGFGQHAERLPAAVEAAAYFVVAEALTNVAKYSGAGRASVSLARNAGGAVVEVSDDGCGGADLGDGSGLTGLIDRLQALDGRLTVESPLGTGTVVRAEIPCASS
ncbi:MAG TPA: histidine kinase [Solirubrobacteraceae bacterium]